MFCVCGREMRCEYKKELNALAFSSFFACVPLGSVEFQRGGAQLAHFADDGRPGGEGLQLAEKRLCILARERDEKAARGLRVGGEVEEDLLRRGQHREMRLHIVHVAVSARGDDAHLSHIARLVHQGERCAVQADGNAAAACHLIAMTEQAEARHVGAGVDIFGASHGVACLFVERRHVGIDRVARGGGDEIGLDGVDKTKVVIGYEPIWSIGPGKTPAGKEYITKIARFVKEVTGGIDVVYGGGLKVDNAEMLASIDEIDGGLIALTRFQGEIGFYPDEYLEIIRTYLGK